MDQVTQSTERRNDLNAVCVIAAAMVTRSMDVQEATKDTPGATDVSFEEIAADAIVFFMEIKSKLAKAYVQHPDMLLSVA